MPSRRRLRASTAYAVTIAASLHSLLAPAEVLVGYRDPFTGVATTSTSDDEGDAGPPHFCIGDSAHSNCCSARRCEAIRKSTLLSTCCGNNSTGAAFPLLITATPRSGTSFMSSLLTKLGIRIANDGQQPYGYGMVSWIHAFQDERYNLWWTKAQDLKGVKFGAVWHLVRDPLKTLTSVAFTEPVLKPRYARYLSRHIALRPSPNATGPGEAQILSGMQFFVQWHSFIDGLGVPLLRLDDLVAMKNLSALDDLFESIGAPPPDPIRVYRLINETLHNQRAHRDTLHWRELCQVDASWTRKFLELSQSYGYYSNMTTTEVCDAEMSSSSTRMFLGMENATVS